MQQADGAAELRLTVGNFPLSARRLLDWSGACLELVNELLWSHPEGQILYVENIPDDFGWKYHAALVLDGLVYDAWHPSFRLPPAEYVRAVFGPGTTWEVMADDDESEENSPNAAH